MNKAEPRDDEAQEGSQPGIPSQQGDKAKSQPGRGGQLSNPDKKEDKKSSDTGKGEDRLQGPEE